MADFAGPRRRDRVVRGLALGARRRLSGYARHARHLLANNCSNYGFRHGRYLAGRLRTKWAAIHTDEVHFRDTAHGLLAWSVSLVITGAFLMSAAGTLAGGMRPSGPGMALPASSDIAAGGQNLRPNDYFVDLLFRSDHPIEDAKDAGMRAEAASIFTYALGHKQLLASDQAYLAAMVAANTGLSAPESERRVTEVYAQAQQAADEARKAAAHLALWLFISFLIGAFSASYAATIGGRQRDQVPADY